MIIFKELTLAQLEYEYDTRLGFVFQADQKSSDRAIEFLCKTLIEFGITKEYPEFVCKLPDNVVVFVYKDDFDGPQFFQTASIATQAGVCKVYSLYNFLNK